MGVFLLFVTLLPTCVFAETPQPDGHQNTLKKQDIPSPLTLEQAIAFAKEHPRTKLGFQEQQLFPASMPIFMDCQRLTFTNTNSIDNTRNSVNSPLIAPLQQQQLRILQAFFDVLLADLNNGFINEKMAGSYITYDRAKNRFELKQLSERVVARLDAEYQIVLQQFRASTAIQRISRSSLAQAMNAPQQLPSDLLPPDAFKIPDELPELDLVYQKAIKNNAWMTHLKERFSNENKKAMASLMHMHLRQQLLELLLRLQVLKSAKQQAETENNLRELNLDMSRALYDMEVKADLGNSMTLQSKAILQEERIHYCQYLSWAQLNALQGIAILSPPPADKNDEKDTETSE
jgi:hypothetical protein